MLRRNAGLVMACLAVGLLALTPAKAGVEDAPGAEVRNGQDELAAATQLHLFDMKCLPIAVGWHATPLTTFTQATQAAAGHGSCTSSIARTFKINARTFTEAYNPSLNRYEYWGCISPARPDTPSQRVGSTNFSAAVLTQPRLVKNPPSATEGVCVVPTSRVNRMHRATTEVFVKNTSGTVIDTWTDYSTPWFQT